MPCSGNLLKLKVAIPGIPIDKFVLASNHSLKLEADLTFGGLDSKGAEGDFHFHTPPLLIAMGGDMPNLIPGRVHFTAFVNDQCIV